ncbi:PASTA domain-containing protein [Propionibacteriaceae bacterium G1746]
MDDPALTRLMLGSTTDGVPDDDDLEITSALGADIEAAGSPPKPVSYRARSASSPATSVTGRVSRSDLGRGRPSASTPTSPVDLPGAMWKHVDAEDDGGADDEYSSSGTPVPRPRPRRRPGETAARPGRPRSQSTPIFPHVSQDPVHRRRRGLVALVLVLLLALTSGVTGYWYVAHGRWTSAPAITGHNLATAQAAADQAGFSLATTEAFSETVPAGVLISTEPLAGARVLKGSHINAVVSKGPERYAMPGLANMNLAQATDAIQSARLSVGKVTKAWHETAAVNSVLQASQKPGTLLKPGTSIDLVISQGRQPIAIPSVVGKGSSAATGTLTALGFKVTSTEQNNDKVAKGDVVSQSPAKGSGHKGDTVKLVISKGPVLVAVPRVTGADEATARQRLANAGFTTKVVYNTEAWVRLNVVAAQDPVSGKLAPKGSTVTIYVS